MQNAAPANVKLRRELGLFSAVSLIITVMIGSGIFVSASNALRNTGSVNMCLIVWMSCGLLALLAALSMAELGTVVPKSGGPFTFILTAFNDLHEFWGPLPSFLYSSVNIWFVRPASVAIMTLTFAEYSVRPFSRWASMSPDAEFTWKKTVSVVALCVITAVNYFSVKCFVKVQNLFTTCKIAACIFVIVGGLYQLYLGNTKNLTTGFEGTRLTAKSFSIVFYSGLYAYDGWASVTIVSEEIKNPQRNIPLSVVFAVPLVTTIYLLMNVSYLTVLSVQEMISAPAVAVEFGARVFGHFSYIIPLSVAVSTFGCALTLQFEATRMCFAAGRENQMLEIFSYVNVKTLTPTPAVFLQCSLTFVCLLCGDIIVLIEFTSFLTWMFYGTCMAALLVMRRTKGDVRRPFKVPTAIPVFVLVASVLLFLTPIVSQPKPQFLVALAIIALSFVAYVPFVYQKRRLPTLDRFNELIKRTMNVVPPEKEEPK